MSEKMKVQKQAVPESKRAVQSPVGVPILQLKLPALPTQMDSASRLGHSLGAVGINAATPLTPIQRQENPEEEDKEGLQREPVDLQRQEEPEEEKEEQLQTKPDEPSVGPEGGRVPPAIETAIQSARGRGQPLEDGVQAQMSQSLGHDFSGVRVHSDTEADTLNRQLSAKAFTTGQDIFFKNSAYDPSSSSGRELLAHELSHVVQQSSGRVGGNNSGMTVRPAGDALEQEADGEAQRGKAAVNHSDKSGSAREKQPQLAIAQRFVIQRGGGIREFFANLFGLKPKPPNFGVQVLTQGRPSATRHHPAPVNHPQTGDYTCGPACVTFVLRQLGIDTSESAVLEEGYTRALSAASAAGATIEARRKALRMRMKNDPLAATTEADLVEMVTMYGVNATGGGNVFAASDVHPAIVLWNWHIRGVAAAAGIGHWMVAYGGGASGSIQLYDPSGVPMKTVATPAAGGDWIVDKYRYDNKGNELIFTVNSVIMCSMTGGRPAMTRVMGRP